MAGYNYAGAAGTIIEGKRHDGAIPKQILQQNLVEELRKFLGKNENDDCNVLAEYIVHMLTKEKSDANTLSREIKEFLSDGTDAFMQWLQTELDKELSELEPQKAGSKQHSDSRSRQYNEGSRREKSSRSSDTKRHSRRHSNRERRSEERRSKPREELSRRLILMKAAEQAATSSSRDRAREQSGRKHRSRSRSKSPSRSVYMKITSSEMGKSPIISGPSSMNGHNAMYDSQTGYMMQSGNAPRQELQGQHVLSSGALPYTHQGAQMPESDQPRAPGKAILKPNPRFGAPLPVFDGVGGYPAEHEMHPPAVMMAPPKARKKCMRYPDCPFGASCAFFHPVTPCANFPRCPFGSACFYIHPPIKCKYGVNCQNATCNFVHETLAANKSFIKDDIRGAQRPDGLFKNKVWTKEDPEQGQEESMQIATLSATLPSTPPNLRRPNADPADEMDITLQHLPLAASADSVVSDMHTDAEYSNALAKALNDDLSIHT